mgnify:CR=1 FL=1|tara:strand:- start:366 stop:1151 length:786 start_codon:yes stop_codon:yes gene_type:complete
MANLYAGSYGYGGPGFYFDSSEEYDKKYKENLNKGESAPNEEYEIDFIDGSAFELAVFNAVEVHQGDVTKYFDLLDELDEDLMPAIHALTDYGGYDFKDALEKAEEASVFEGSLTDAAYDYVESVGWEGMGDSASNYFDYDSFGRDIRIEGSMDPANDEDQYPVNEEPAQSDFEDEDDYDEAVEQYEEFSEAEKDYDRMSDEDLGYSVVDDIYGGVENMSEENQENYFNYEAFGRDANLNSDWHAFRYDDTDYVILNWSGL